MESEGARSPVDSGAGSEARWWGWEVGGGGAVEVLADLVG